MVIVNEKGRAVVLNSDGSTKKSFKVNDFDYMRENEKIAAEKIEEQVLKANVR